MKKAVKEAKAAKKAKETYANKAKKDIKKTWEYETVIPGLCELENARALAQKYMPDINRH